jgi:hypothetical protein
MDLDEDTSWFEALRRGGRQDVFNLPIELLAAQISAAAEYALSKPEAYPALASALDPGSLEAAAADRDDADRLRATGEPSADTAPSHSRDQDEERNFRVAQRVRASIDRLQISIGQGWRQSIQGAAVWLAGAYGIGLERLGLGRIALAQPTGPYTLPRNTQPAYVFAALILGGVIAWTIRDVLATLERSRR